MTRFQQSDDLAGQAEALFTSGLAYQGKEQSDEASSRFTQALALYQQMQQPLGEADVRYQQANLLLEAGNFESAKREFARAIALVEHVSQTLHAPEELSRFLQQYAELYAQSALITLQEGKEERAREQLSSYTRIAGPAGTTAVARYLQAYETSIQVKGEGLSYQEQLENASFVKKIKKLRKDLH